MFVQILINGLILAGNYALVAVGLTLIFGVMRMVNFAEGQSVMIGAFVALTVTPFVGYIPAIGVAMVVNAMLGVILERTAFRPFRGAELNGLIASMGMSIILINLAELIWGTVPRPFDTPLNDISVTFGTVGVSLQRLLVIACSVGLLLGLWWLVRFSSLGRQFRAVSEDAEVASAMGIDANRIARTSVVIGSSLAAAAGALSGPVNMLAPEMGQAEMLNAFAAIILGGFGNVNGTILGALLIGMVQSVSAVYISNAYSNSIAFGLLIVTLIFFPRGLVPERMDENV
ncbi:MAG: branched-chain amino acid ABC transporter permease [Pseudolabrys sp.]